jgi:hypothetical protein
VTGIEHMNGLNSAQLLWSHDKIHIKLTN